MHMNLRSLGKERKSVFYRLLFNSHFSIFLWNKEGENVAAQLSNITVSTPKGAVWLQSFLAPDFLARHWAARALHPQESNSCTVNTFGLEGSQQSVGLWRMWAGLWSTGGCSFISQVGSVNGNGDISLSWHFQWSHCAVFYVRKQDGADVRVQHP